MMADEKFISRYYPELVLTFTKVHKLKLHRSNQPSDCCICLEPCNWKLSCNHPTHQLCILRWLERQRTCPCCRQECQLVEQSVVDWFYVSIVSKLSERFIGTFQHKVNWKAISMAQVLSERFIIKYQHKVDWENISAYQVLSEPFIKRFAGKLDWDNISTYQVLSEDFIKRYADKLGWENISTYQVLSEDFIKRFADKLDWIGIILNQKVSDRLIKTYQNKVDWVTLSNSYKLSNGFIRRFAKYLLMNDIYESQDDPLRLDESRGLARYTHEMKSYTCVKRYQVETLR